MPVGINWYYIIPYDIIHLLKEKKNRPDWKDFNNKKCELNKCVSKEKNSDTKSDGFSSGDCKLIGFNDMSSKKYQDIGKWSVQPWLNMGKLASAH